VFLVFLAGDIKRIHLRCRCGTGGTRGFSSRTFAADPEANPALPIAGIGVAEHPESPITSANKASPLVFQSKIRFMKQE
jgi:hypothetical protein